MLSRNLPQIALIGSLALCAACSNSDTESKSSGTGTLFVNVSGESLGVNGYPFPPSAGQEVAFVDGWDLKFDRILVTLDKITLAEEPDKSPGDQSIVGKQVMLLNGPWAMDLVKPAPIMDEDKGGAGKIAIRLPVEVSNTLDLEQRYAFGFDVVSAKDSAVRINIDSADSDYQDMVQRNYAVLFIGTATLKATDSACKSSDPSYDFSKLPKKVSFRFGLTKTATYANCQNPDNTAAPIEGEEFQRGIQLKANAPTVAQITIHTDHLFWATVNHGAVPMFNHFAANAKISQDVATVTLEDLQNVPVAPVTDPSGKPLPWRSCVSESQYTLPTSPSTMVLETAGQPINNLAQFVAFNGSTAGHLNADGICHVTVRD